MRINEIEKRLSEIKNELSADGADLDALESEVETLTEERKTILGAIERRKELLGKVKTDGTVVETYKEERKSTVELTREEILASPEYRNYFLKSLQGANLTEAEQRAGEAFSSVTAAAAIPTMTAEQLFDKLVQTAPLLNEIELLRVAGNITFAVEGANASAAIHTENGLLTAADDTLVSVTLGGYEICKLVRISAKVRTMAIGAFESWLTSKLAEMIGRVIENVIINGNGTTEPKGIEEANATWTDTTNAVQWATSGTPLALEILELISYLKGGYQRGAKFLMNSKMFWGKVQTLRDDAKAPLVKEGPDGNYLIYGFPVMLSDYVADGTMFFGNFKKYVGNLAQDIMVESSASSGFAYNAVDYRGTAIFDGKPAIAEAFVKGATSIS